MDLTKSIDLIKPQALSTLKELIRIDSEERDPVHTESGEIYPFGQGVQDAFAYMLSKGRECGFQVRNVDNYGGHIDFAAGAADPAQAAGQSDSAGQAKSETGEAAAAPASAAELSGEVMGIIGHLDVVPVGDGWSFPPYCGEEEDGYVLGRGTTDDKGPVVAAFYAMKALKDAGYEPSRTVRLILGLDEETRWKGMKYYLEHEKAPDFGFTPDGDFPLIRGEMGMLTFDIVRKLGKSPGKGLTLSRLSGGEAPNIVPDRARAVVKAGKETYEVIREKASAYEMMTGHRIRIRGVGKALELITEGKSCHGATPWEGLNAISVMFEFLGQLNFENEDLNEFIDFYNRHIGFCLNGSKIGAGLSDEASGDLVFNNGMISYDGESITLNVNVRFPVTCTEEQVYDGMTQVLDEYGLGIVKSKGMEPLYFEEDHPLIRTLMEVYQDKTGDMEHQPLVIGGGTYAKCCPNVVAFGGLFPGDPDVMHQRDEKIEIDRFYQMIDIYAEAIVRLTR